MCLMLQSVDITIFFLFLCIFSACLLHVQGCLTNNNQEVNILDSMYLHWYIVRAMFSWSFIIWPLLWWPVRSVIYLFIYYFEYRCDGCVVWESRIDERERNGHCCWFRSNCCHKWIQRCFSFDLCRTLQSLLFLYLLIQCE